MRTNSFFVCIAVGFCALTAQASTPSLLGEGSHCVAFKVERTSMMVHSSAVIGKNCEISAQVLPELGGLYRVEVAVPISGFKSGDEDRDLDVVKTLKANVQPDIVFKSNALNVAQWHKLLKEQDFKIAGQMSIAGHEYPLTIDSHYSSAGQGEIDGVAKVKFKDFNIDPPKIGGGLIAKTDQEIELHFHLLGSRILGADTIRPESPPPSSTPTMTPQDTTEKEGTSK